MKGPIMKSDQLHFKMTWTLIAGAVLNCGSMNKTDKIPELTGLSDEAVLKKHGYTDEQIAGWVAAQKYPATCWNPKTNEVELM
jgi:hypothetical protein